jgi:hypothetical protein
MKQARGRAAVDDEPQPETEDRSQRDVNHR